MSIPNATIEIIANKYGAVCDRCGALPQVIVFATAPDSPFVRVCRPCASDVILEHVEVRETT